MNIGNMPEEELDDLFRKSASEFHPEFDPAAWQAMEKKLDAQPAHPGFWQRLSWLSALFLTMGLGFWISLLVLQYKKDGTGLPFPSHTDSAQPGAQAPTNDTGRKPADLAQTATPKRMPATTRPAKPATADKPQAPPLSPPAKSTPLAAGKSGLTRSEGLTPAPRPLATDGGRQQQRPPVYPQQKGLAVVPPALPENKPAEAPGAAGVEAAAQPDNQAGRETISVGEAGKDLQNKGLQEKNAAVQEIIPDPARMVQLIVLTGADSLAKPVTVPGDSPLTPDKKVLRARSPLAIRLLVAPDLSMAGFARPDGISTNAGIELSYQLTPRWRLATGVIKARKVYGARPKDYGNQAYWKNRTLPDDINAVCRVLDVPLNIGYQLVTRGRSAFTLSTGLSSYWMLTEDYHYHYQNPAGYPYSRTWKVRNENRHLFSIYNLSGLYSHQLTPAMSWGIEPFVKVPLVGVGGGKIKLSSAGVFFSFGYRLR
jgi:hypothetical protein